MQDQSKISNFNDFWPCCMYKFVLFITIQTTSYWETLPYNRGTLLDSITTRQPRWKQIHCKNVKHAGKRFTDRNSQDDNHTLKHSRWTCEDILANDYGEIKQKWLWRDFLGRFSYVAIMWRSVQHSGDSDLNPGWSSIIWLFNWTNQRWPSIPRLI